MTENRNTAFGRPLPDAITDMQAAVYFALEPYWNDEWRYDDLIEDLSAITAAVVSAIENETLALRAENDRLRRLLAESPADCPYCKLPRDRMGECVHGFPGCARADDMCLDGGPTITPEMEALLTESNARDDDTEMPE